MEKKSAECSVHLYSSPCLGEENLSNEAELEPEDSSVFSKSFTKIEWVFVALIGF